MQVLLELQFERLANGTDDALGQTVGTLQDMTSLQKEEKIYILLKKSITVTFELNCL